MIGRMYEVLRSLGTGLLALTALVLAMMIGSVTLLKTGGYESLNSMPLLRWAVERSLKDSYWLLLSIGCVGLLAVNTVLCSIESLMKKAAAAGLLMKISPQVIHVGFLLIMVGHLFSAIDSFRTMAVVAPEEEIRLSEGAFVRFSDIRSTEDARGRVIGMSLTMTVLEGGSEMMRAVLSPNNPAFFGGLGFYLKDARTYPRTVALIEVSRDSGALWALAGGIIFFAGNVLLVVLKLRRERLSADRP